MTKDPAITKEPTTAAEPAMTRETTMTRTPCMTKEEIIAAIKGMAEKMGRVPTLAEVRRATKLSKHAIRKYFLTYARALAECGLEGKGPGHEAEMTGLFQDWAALVRKLGKVPTMAEYEMEGSYSVRPMTRRFGGWTHVPAGMLEYAGKMGLKEEWSDVLDVVSGHVAQAAGPGRTLVRQNGPDFRPSWGTGLDGRSGTGGAIWRPKLQADQPVYGTPLLPCPLSHAPTNELGVVFLFGSVAREMGFMVMRLQQEFPDCEAMREVEPGRWQRVRIEFEYESRNFLAHMHPAGGCDLIVCWKHNWEGCPVEVVELREVCRRFAQIAD